MTTNTITEQLGQLIIRNAEKAERGLDGAIDFTLQQAPLLCQEYIHWKVVVGACSLACLLGFIIMFVLSIRWAIKRNTPELLETTAGGFSIMICVITGIALLPAFIEFPRPIYDGLQAAVAPRVALVEMAKSLIK